MKHLEDLDTKTFIEYVDNLDEFVASEKIDGSELIFGFDEQGKLYTSREEKGGKRYYKESDWPIAFWTTGFRGAHAALEHFENTLRAYVKNGESVEIEILCGDRPNTVQYQNSINRIVFLRPVLGNPNIDALSFFLNNREELVILKQVPYTENGWSVSYYEYTTQEWAISSVPTITKKWKDVITENLIENLKKEDIELSLKRITPTNKQAVLEARSTIQKKKDIIKQHLINLHVSKTRSIFSEGLEDSWIEGLVFRHPKTGLQFKLVDKEKFTAENTKRHAYIKHLRTKYWKTLTKNLNECYDFDIKYAKMDISCFDDLRVWAGIEGFEEMQTKMLGYCGSALYGLHLEFADCKELDKQNIKEEFASLHSRITNLQEEITLSTCNEHLLEIVLFEHISLEHRKQFADDTRPIKAADVNATIQFLTSIIGVYSKPEDILGSWNTSNPEKLSNDIDICIDKNSADIEYIKLALEAKNIKYNYSAGLDIIHIIFPIKGQSENGHVQIDLIFSDIPDWTRFWFKGRTTVSNYKGLYRNALLRAIAGADNEVKTEKGEEEPYYRKGFFISPRYGLQWCEQERKIGKNKTRNKKFEVISEKPHITNIEQVLHHLFPNCQFDASDVIDFETTWKKVKKHKNKTQRRLIAKIMIKILKEGKYKIPRELIYDL